MPTSDNKPQKLPGVSVSSYTLADGTVMWQRVVGLAKQPGEARGKQLRQRGFSDEIGAILDGNAVAERYRKPSAAMAAHGTVQSELERWLDIKATDTPLSTVKVYRYRFKTHVYPHIGSEPIHQAVKPDAMARFYTMLRDVGGAQKKGLAESTVLNIHYSIMEAFRTLGIDVRDVSPPKAKRQQSKKRADVIIRQMNDDDRIWWTQAEAKQFLGFVKDHRLFFVWCLIVVCGIRRGEAAGIRLSDFDADKGIIRLVNQRTTDPVTNRVKEGLPKYESVRVLPLAPMLAAVGRQHLEILKRERVAYESRKRGRWKTATFRKWEQSGYLAVKPDGSPYHPDSLRQLMQRLMIAARVPVITLHGGRHTSASVASDEGVPVKTMQGIGGWSRPDVLLGTYTHADLSSRAAGLAILENALLGEGPLR